MTTDHNPFSPAISQRDTQTTLGDVEQSRAIAETQAAMIIAKRFPRDPIAAMDRILNACTRPTLAESALYTYSRGGTDITGPSIRLAEALAQAWGNIQFGIRELEQRNGESTIEAYAWDVESNTREVKTFQVRHERHTKKGSMKLTDPRDIYELTANQGARRLRACILGVIPGDVTEAAQNQCDVTLKAKAEVTPQSLTALGETFAAFGVTKEQIEKRIQRRLDAMLPAQLVGLRKIYNSLKDGMSKPDDWFETVGQSQASKTVTKPNFSTEPVPEIKAVKGGVSGGTDTASSQETSGHDAALPNSTDAARGIGPDEKLDKPIVGDTKSKPAGSSPLASQEMAYLGEDSEDAAWLAGKK